MSMRDPLTISIRAKPEDLKKINEIRKRLKEVGQRSRNSDVIRFALKYTESDWFPVIKK